ncbi:Uncharacterised protein [Vibrio cholerae]|nr:Uncharacterised protein [Vibrio cholerae]
MQKPPNGRFFYHFKSERLKLDIQIRVGDRAASQSHAHRAFMIHQSRNFRLLH